MFAKLDLRPRKNRIKSRTLAGELFYIFIALFLALFTVILTVVVLWAVLNAFKSGDEFDAGHYFSCPQVSHISVNGKGKDISDEDLISVGVAAKLTKKFCRETLDMIREESAVLSKYVLGVNLS